MWDWVVGFFSSAIKNYKEMTALAVFMTFIKLSISPFFLILEKITDRIFRKKKISRLMKRGMTYRDARESILNEERDFKDFMRKNSLTSKFLRKFYKSKKAP